MSLLESPTEKEHSLEPEIEGFDVIPKLATAALEQITDSQALKQAARTDSGLSTMRTNNGSIESDCEFSIPFALLLRQTSH